MATIHMPNFNVLIVVAVIATAGAWWGAWLLRHDAKVAAAAETKIVQASQDKANKNAAKAAKAHDAARAPGALDRLRADPKSCFDCN